MKHIVFLLVMLTFTCLSQFTCLAAVIHVPADQPTIQAGIDAAVDGDTVLVADGTYTGFGNRDISFRGKSIIVTSENGAATCIIDCQGSEQDNHRGFIFDTPNDDISILSGFTIRNGYHEFGGGICYKMSNSYIVGCVIENNKAQYGGGISIKESFWSEYLQIYNCIFSSDQAEHGGAIACDILSALKCSNCIFMNNTAGVGGYLYKSGGCIIVIRNCIAWNNTPQEISDSAAWDPSIVYSNIQGGHTGIGNIDTNPLFIGGDPYDYHLSPDSPCIDAGTDYNAPTFDLEGNPRPSGGEVDMGAYEYHGWPSIPRVYVKMPSHLILPGDHVKCLATVWNPYDEPLSDHRLFVVLDVFGQMFMAPSFSEFDSYPWSFGPGRTVVFVLPEFEWPDNVGTASDIVWYAFLTNMEMTELASPIGVFDSWWREYKLLILFLCHTATVHAVDRLSNNSG